MLFEIDSPVPPGQGDLELDQRARSGSTRSLNVSLLKTDSPIAWLSFTVGITSDREDQLLVPAWVRYSKRKPLEI